MEASSAINAPHPDAPPDADDFFGGEGDEDATAAQQAEAAAAADAAAAEAEPAPDAPEPEVGPADPDAPPVEAQPAPPPPPADPPAAAPGDGDGSGDGDGDGDDAEQPKSSGTQERPYVVLRELVLTPDVLKALLEDAEQTDAGQYRKGYFVLEESLEARNVKHALGKAFNDHNERIGQKPRLVALTHRSWQPKTVSPKTRTVESLDFA